jgi:hypothetical protein
VREALDDALRRELKARGEGLLLGFFVDSASPAKGPGWVHVAAFFAIDPRRAAELRDAWEELWPPRGRVFPPPGVALAALLDLGRYDPEASGEAAAWVVEESRTRELPEPRIGGGADA